MFERWELVERRSHDSEAERLGIVGLLAQARTKLNEVEAADYWRTLSGTLGAEPIEAYR
jgi:hypothetical protein